MPELPPTTPCPCPCDSQRLFVDCCQVYLSRHTFPPTAEALMRSRYSAFVLGDTRYLLETWHISMRPTHIDIDTDTHWLGLKVLDTQAGGEQDKTGTVRFVARYKIHGKGHRLAEHSDFVQEQGRWFYVNGTQDTSSPAQPKRHQRSKKQ